MRQEGKQTFIPEMDRLPNIMVQRFWYSCLIWKFWGVTSKNYGDWSPSFCLGDACYAWWKNHMSKESLEHGKWKYTLPPIIMVQWKTHPKWKEKKTYMQIHPFSTEPWWFPLNHDYGRKGISKNNAKVTAASKGETNFQGSNKRFPLPVTKWSHGAYAKTIDQQTNLGGGSTWLHQLNGGRLNFKPFPIKMIGRNWIYLNLVGF